MLPELHWGPPCLLFTAAFCYKGTSLGTVPLCPTRDALPICALRPAFLNVDWAYANQDSWQTFAVNYLVCIDCVCVH